MLHLHRAERADALVEALGTVLGEPLDDPLQPEIVSVPTRGVERWLSQRLSASLGASVDRADGVCANVDFPFPATVVGGAVAAATGVDRDTDPWRPERCIWPLMEVVDHSLAQPWLADLAAHLGAAATDPNAKDANAEQIRRFPSVRHIADLYDSYAVHRPQMVRAWAAGEDIDGVNRPLPQGYRWQAELWRRLAQRLGCASPAERLDDACRRLDNDAALVNLPARLSMFGLTRLPASYLQVLHALAAHRDVHLFLLHPSPVLWQQLAAFVGRTGVMRRATDQSADLCANPLLTSWGRDAREMQLVLAAGRGDHVDHHHGGASAVGTLLERLQDDVRADRSPPGVPLPRQPDVRPLLAAADRSVEVHDCHGRARQVEVVRDVVLHLLADDDTLEARDIIVMCPDIETYAPLIHATFGAGSAGDDTADDGSDEGSSGESVGSGNRPDLRVRLADRSIRQTNPVLAVVSELLALADARLTASQVLDLAGRDAVRRRFRLNDEDLTRLKDWVAATGIRWGLDAEHRAAFQLSRVAANTWRAGLDRTLLGIAMAEEDERLFAGVLPLDDVGSGSIDLAGRFAELLGRLQAALDSFSQPQSVPAWLTAIGRAADAMTACAGRDSWQRDQLQRLLDDLATEAAAAGPAASPVLSLAEARSLLADRLRGRPTRANFRTGHLTVCTMVPMRSVPHRVVVLLGLDDGVFPRQTARDGDDLALQDPYVGDRDSRSEDRQLLLDALMAATERLVITYTGRDERTNAGRPPAVPLGELLDAVDWTVRTPDDGPARRRIVVTHPLQPFDPRNFTVGALLADRPWSFDGVALEGARALSGPRAGRPPFLAARLPAPDTGVIELESLVRFVQHPVKAFLRRRLGVSVGDHFEAVDDTLPVELDPLEKWGVGQRLLDARLAGADAEACVAAELARGILPPGAFAGPVLSDVRPTVESLVSAAQLLAAGAGEPQTVDISIRLGDGRTVAGTVPVIGTLLRSVTYSRVGAKHRLAAWVRFLCLTAAFPGEEFAAATVGRRRSEARKGARVTTARLAAFPGDLDARRARAVCQLTDLIDLYDRGMREPLPLYCATSATYAAATAAGKNADKEAQGAWESAWNFPREDREPEHMLVLGDVRPYVDLLQAGAGDDESGPGWAGDEPSRFGRYAHRLWNPLLPCEELVDR